MRMGANDANTDPISIIIRMNLYIGIAYHQNRTP